jgi:hypothetical protein
VPARHRAHGGERSVSVLDIVIVTILAAAIVVALPVWRYSHSWGNRPVLASVALLLAFVAFWYVLGPLL